MFSLSIEKKTGPLPCFLLILLQFFVLEASLSAAEYHLKAGANLQNALWGLKSSGGDTLFLGPGDYDLTNNISLWNCQGSVSAWTTIRNEPGQALPRIHLGAGGTGQGFSLNSCSYLCLLGLEIVGGLSNDNGVDGVKFNSCHHVQFVNGSVHDMGGSGISTAWCSQVLIEGNTVMNNGLLAHYGTSGISVWESVLLSANNDFVSSPFYQSPLGNLGGYQILIRNNSCFGNLQNSHSDYAGGAITDGNGINIDQNSYTDLSNSHLPFAGMIQVANNVCWYNGGPGVMVYNSDNCDVVHNTCYWNARNVGLSQYGLKGEIHNCVGNSNRFFNNITCASPGNAGSYWDTCWTGVGSKGVWANNDYFGCTSFVAGANDTTNDPMLFSPGLAAGADFHLQSGSVCIGGGTTNAGVLLDHDGTARKSPPDLGAYQFVSPSATNAPPQETLVANQGSGFITLSWSGLSLSSSYTVMRSGTAGGPYVQIASGLVASTFTDNGVTPGATYFYVVEALGSNGIGRPSTKVSSVPLNSFEAWRLAKFGTSANTGIAADSANPSGDGIPNLMKYALCLDPLSTNAAARPQAILTNGYLQMTFSRTNDPLLIYSVEGTADFTAWTNIWSSTGASNVPGPVTVRDSNAPASSTTRRFLRLRVTAP